MAVVVLLTVLWMVAAVLLGLPLARLALPKESRLVVLLCYSALAGHATQALGLFVLWSFIPLAGAYWAAVTLSLAFGSGLLALHLRHARPAQEWGLGAGHTLLLALLIPTLGFFGHRLYTVGYTGWDAEPLFWHPALAAWLSRVPFPPTNPLEPDHLLQYRFGLHALVGAVYGSSGATPPAVFALVVGGLLPLSALALVGASMRVLGSARAGFVALLLAIFGGSLLPYFNVAGALAGLPVHLNRNSVVGGIFAYGNNFDMLHVNPTIPMGFVTFLGAAWLAWEGALAPRATPAAFALGALGMTWLGLLNEVYFAALAAGLAGTAALVSSQALWSRDSGWWRGLLKPAALVLLANLLVTLRGGLAGGLSPFGEGSGSIGLVLNTDHFGSVSGPPGYARWIPMLSGEALADSALLLFGVPVLALVAWRFRNYFALCGLLVAGANLVLWMSVYPRTFPPESYRLGQAAIAVYLTFLPFTLAPIWPRGTLARIAHRVATIGLVILTLPHVVFAVWLAFQPPAPTMATPASPDYRAAEYLRGSSGTWRVLVPVERPGDTWELMYRSYGTGAGMREILGMSAHAIPIGFSEYYNPEKYLPHYLRASVEFDRGSMDALRLDWVYVLPWYSSGVQKLNLEAAVARGDLVEDKTFGMQGTETERVLYRVRSPSR